MLGYKGLLLADTEQKQRDLIFNAVKLHLRGGTPSAIVLALENIGITGVAIIENPKLLYDGQGCYDSSDCYNGRRWDRFIVDYSQSGLSDETIDLIDRLIEVWQNGRSNRFYPNPNIPLSAYI